MLAIGGAVRTKVGPAAVPISQRGSAAATAAMTLSSFELIEGQSPAPDAACIQADNIGIIATPLERCPVPKQNRFVFCQSVGMAKPRRHLATRQDIGNRFGALADEIELARGGAVAHAGEVVGDHP